MVGIDQEREYPDLREVVRPGAPTIFVVIPVYNRKEYTRDCLNSLMCQTVSGRHRVIVVDDGSTDGTAEMLAGEFPDVIVLTGNGNLFWSAATNWGIRYAMAHGAEYILTLNNDTVASKDFLEKMIFWAELNPDAMLGALDLDIKTGRPHYGGERVNEWNQSRYLLDELKSEHQKGLHEVSLYPGRGLWIPRMVFDLVGLFEEKRLPHYLADYDYTQMARRKGFSIFCNYDAKLFTYPEEGGDPKLRKDKSLINYFQHLFGIKGGGNLKNFTIYAFRNFPRKYLLPSLLFGYLKRIGGYWLK